MYSMTLHTLKQVSLNDVFLFLCVPCVNTNNNNNNKKRNKNKLTFV